MVILKETASDPAGIVTEAGTEAMLGSLLDKATGRPWIGATLVRLRRSPWYKYGGNR